MIVKVCDTIMGAGKTESAITLMNQDKESRYVFITPYLDEVERIKRSCSGRKFKDPQSKGKGKLENLHYLLSMRDNIASTHALFESYNDETISLIQDGGYKLILDEVFQAVQTIPISPKDLQMLKRDMIEVDSEYRVRWVNDDYEGRFEDLRDMCMTGNVILYNDCLLLWKFPIEVFQSFDEVIILTYMFDAQVQKYYIYFFCKRRYYGIGELISVGPDCKYCNYPHASARVNVRYEDIADNLLVNFGEQSPHYRWLCTFKGSPSKRTGAGSDEAGYPSFHAVCPEFLCLGKSNRYQS